MSNRLSPNLDVLTRSSSLRVLFIVFVAASLLIPWAAIGQDATPSAEDKRVRDAALTIKRITEVAGISPFQTTRIYDRHGNVLYELSDQGRRSIIPLYEMPQDLINATIATEDKNFYRHDGVDWTAVARAAFQNWQADEIVSGASTITQQLVRALLLEEADRYDLSLQRKTREAVLAIDLEGIYAKDEILEMYLNTVFYGHRAYGVVAAAETYFDKKLSELTLAESALLAGLPQSPNFLDPFVNPEGARERQLVVLDLMERTGHITRQERIDAVGKPVRLVPPEYPEIRAPHYVDYVRELLLERFGPEGMRRGLQVYTSLDLRYQVIAETVAQAQIKQIGPKHNASNAAVIMMHPKTGEILAMVGSVDYYDESISGQVNMAVRLRQPGSSIKPIVYASAFDRGWSPASVIWDTPVRYPMGDGGWYIPTNITGRYYGPARLRVALSNSLNVSAVKLLREVGVEPVLATATALGIRSWRDPLEKYGLSLAVGGYEVTLLELTHSFATLANNGAYVQERPIREIRDGAGAVIYKLPQDQPPQYAVSPAAAYQVSSVLSDRRSGRMVFGAAPTLTTSQPTAVKTGTTDGYRDNLTVGYTPYLAVGVWVGNSDGFRLRNALGSQTAAPIWHDIMEAVWADSRLHRTLGYADVPLPQGFKAPFGIYEVPICELRSGQFSATCRKVYDDFLTDANRIGIVSQANLNGGVREQRRGYCLPVIHGEAPPTLLKQSAFIPLPKGDTERATASQWARRYGLSLTTAVDCNRGPVKRKTIEQPALAKPKQLVKFPKTTTKVIVDEASGQLLPGAHAELINRAPTIKLRLKPNSESVSVGRVGPDETIIIRKGPRMAGATPWFEVRNMDRGQIGWLNGVYLRPKRLASGEEGPPAGLQVASRARIKPGLESLYIRSKPGSKYAIVGVVYPRNTIEIQQGPKRVKGVSWYEVLIPGRGIAGWVDGRFIIPRYY